MATTEASFEAVIAPFHSDIQAIAAKLRSLVVEIHPEVCEVHWVQQKITGLGVGPKKMTEHYGYIAPQSKHVNLGFNHGAHLSDPEGLLEGTGKALRHVKVRTLEDAENPALRELLQAAIEERNAALGR